MEAEEEQRQRLLCEYPPGTFVPWTKRKCWSGWIVLDNGCHLWMGNKVNGYGRAGYRGGKHLVHRARYEMKYGSIPEGLGLHHRCENPWCCNPDHCEPVTQRENVLRGWTSPPVWNRAKTHCRNGHALEGDNLLAEELRKGCRVCRMYHLARRKEYYRQPLVNLWHRYDGRARYHRKKGNVAKAEYWQTKADEVREQRRKNSRGSGFWRRVPDSTKRPVGPRNVEPETQNP